MNWSRTQSRRYYLRRIRIAGNSTDRLGFDRREFHGNFYRLQSHLHICGEEKSRNRLVTHALAITVGCLNCTKRINDRCLPTATELQRFQACQFNAAMRQIHILAGPQHLHRDRLKAFARMI